MKLEKLILEQNQLCRKKCEEWFHVNNLLDFSRKTYLVHEGTSSDQVARQALEEVIAKEVEVYQSWMDEERKLLDLREKQRIQEFQESFKAEKEAFFSGMLSSGASLSYTEQLWNESQIGYNPYGGK